jgi:general secretion pathway protein F
MLEAFSSAKEVPQNRKLRADLDKAIEALQDGSSLADALSVHTQLPRMALQMIALGEASARLDPMLQRLAASMAYLVQQRIDRLMTLLTPALTIAIAGVIGAIIFMTMNAILSINELALR